MSTLARHLLRVARHVAPGRRAEWVDAMQAELAHISAQECLPFAAGCLAAAAHEGIIYMFQTGIGAAKFLCLAACLVLAGLGFVHAVRLGHQDTALAITFSASAIVWSAAFLATVLKKWQGLGVVAIIGLALSAGLGLSTMLGIAAVQQNSSLIWALFLEGLLLFGAMFAAAMVFKHAQSATTR